MSTETKAVRDGAEVADRILRMVLTDACPELKGDAFAVALKLGRGAAKAVTRVVLHEACKPWRFSTGAPPDYDGPLTGVFCAGMAYSESLLAKLMGVERYEGGDGSEDFDCDATKTLSNILTGAGLYDPEDGRWASLAAPSAAGGGEIQGDNLAAYLIRQREWSQRVFGARSSAVGLTKHIEKECAEVRANPTDLVEWIDIISLALDGYWRHGGTPETIMRDLNAKQAVCFAREWPVSDNPDEPNEHARPATALEEAMFCVPSQGSNTEEVGRGPGAYGIPGMPDRLSNSDGLRIFSAYYADRLPAGAAAELVTMADEWDEEVRAAGRDPSGPGHSRAEPSGLGPQAECPSRGDLAEHLRNALTWYDRQICTHEDTHRGGGIWTICDACGMKWADDRGGFKPYVDPSAIAAARDALASADGSGEAGETAGLDPKGNSAVGAAETPCENRYDASETLTNPDSPAKTITLTAPQGADLAGLSDPIIVHANMLHGTIAKPSIANIIHLYGREALLAALVPTTSAPPAPAERIAPKTLDLIRQAKQAASAERALYGDSKDAGDLYDELADVLGDASRVVAPTFGERGGASWIDRAAWCAEQILPLIPSDHGERQDTADYGHADFIQGTSIPHLRWMARQLAERRLDSETKACRWLGWLQCGIVSSGLSSLEAEKARNLASHAAPPAASQTEGERP